MKIIKQGDLNRLKRKFECKLCGCVFEAEENEYKREYSQHKGNDRYKAICPTCHRMVLIDHKEGADANHYTR